MEKFWWEFDLEDGGQIFNVNRSLKTQPSHQILPLEFHLFSSNFGLTPRFTATLTLPLDFSLGFFLDFFDIFSTGPGRGVTWSYGSSMKKPT